MRRLHQASAADGPTYPELGLFVRESAEDVANTRKKAENAKDEHKVWLGVEPAVEKESQQAANHDSSDNDEGQFHRRGKLSRKTLGLLFGRGEMVVTIGARVRRHSGPSV